MQTDGNRIARSERGGGRTTSSGLDFPTNALTAIPPDGALSSPVIDSSPMPTPNAPSVTFQSAYHKLSNDDKKKLLAEEFWNDVMISYDDFKGALEMNGFLLNHERRIMLARLFRALANRVEGD